MKLQIFDEVVHFSRKASSFLKKNKAFDELQIKKVLAIVPDFLSKD